MRGYVLHLVNCLIYTFYRFYLYSIIRLTRSEKNIEKSSWAASNKHRAFADASLACALSRCTTLITTQWPSTSVYGGGPGMPQVGYSVENTKYKVHHLSHDHCTAKYYGSRIQYRREMVTLFVWYRTREKRRWVIRDEVRVAFEFSHSMKLGRCIL